ncbi:hypothetical protein NM208_g6544 [Fusarium decemcellulare]|uniref:Uncharacterized protein n=1 Tax=Fusarium decemcellulare TaxID=57161 RepID=A0ACC1SCQ9_9HYPO|nr:hypothetical protein NM208_g6544 [Fusarium decemcellulare]
MMDRRGAVDYEGPASKRVKQACQNCRRRKIRCSGGRPSCLSCQRFLRECDYSPPNPVAAKDVVEQDLPTLQITQRVAVRQPQIPGSLPRDETIRDHGNQYVGPIPSLLSASCPAYDYRRRYYHINRHDRRDLQALRNQKTALVARVCDTYFQAHHNQPYCFFHEIMFRRQLDQHQVPDYLLFAMIAFVAAVSPEVITPDDITETWLGYAERSWSILMLPGYGLDIEDDRSTVPVVQAAALLALVDVEASQLRTAWLKIGHAARLCQAFGLHLEPDQQLPIVEQEQRRRLFWSVYMLDRFSSCSRRRPIAVMDADCSVQLPSCEDAFQRGVHEKTHLLLDLTASHTQPLDKPSTGALLVLMSSTLGRCARYVFDDARRSIDHEPNPWDPASEYSAIFSILALFESTIDITTSAFANMVLDSPTSNDGCTKDQTAGQAIFIDTTASNVSKPWLSSALRTGQKHACLLLSLIYEAEGVGLTICNNFRYYCILLAGSIHGLLICSSDEMARQTAVEYFDGVLKYLDARSDFEVSNIASAGLRILENEAPRFSEVLDVTKPLPLSKELDVHIIWSIVDYVAIFNPKKTVSSSMSLAARELDASLSKAAACGNAGITGSCQIAPIPADGANTEVEPSWIEGFLDRAATSRTEDESCWEFLAPSTSNLDSIYDPENRNAALLDDPRSFTNFDIQSTHI